MLRFAPHHCRAGAFAIALAGLAVPGLSGCSNKGNPDYGSVRIELRTRSGIDADELFSQTKTIIIRAYYNDCVRDFYEGPGADQQLQTVDGDEILMEWKERLCAASDPTDTGRGATSFFECDAENVELRQQFDVDTPYLEIRILMDKGSDATNLSVENLRVGPLPTRELTGCKSAFQFNPTSMRALDDQGAELWKVGGDEVGTDVLTPDSPIAWGASIEPSRAE